MKIDGITIFLICLLVLFGAYSIFLMFRNKKANKEAMKMLDDLKVGDKVKTHVGIFGTIISISETTVGKTLVLETGDGKNKTRLEMDYRVIAGKDDKQLAIYDENNNLITENVLKTAKEQPASVKLEDAAVKLSEVDVKLADTQIKLDAKTNETETNDKKPEVKVKEKTAKTTKNKKA